MAGVCVVPEDKRGKYFKKEWSTLSNGFGNGELNGERMKFV